MEALEHLSLVIEKCALSGDDDLIQHADALARFVAAEGIISAEAALGLRERWWAVQQEERRAAAFQAAVAAFIAARAAADLAFCDLAADVVFGAVGVERNLRAVEHHEQFGFIGVEPGEQPVERGEAGASLEDPVEAGAQSGLAAGRRV